jgi:hypothetical protein
MKTIQFSVTKAGRFASLTFIFIQLISFSSFGQISLNDDEKANSRKIRREAKKYEAEDVKESHLDMGKYSFKKGEAGQHPVTEEMEASVIYYGPNPVKAEKKTNRKRR